MNTSPSLDPSGRTRQREIGPVIIDTDPGIDDLVALALAARSPLLDIVAVTTTYGNASLEATARNARELLRLADRTDVPVHPGSDRPLVRPLVTAPETHGATGVGHAPIRTTTPAGVTRNEHVLTELLTDCSRPITLVTLGPLTNLAHALEDDRKLVRARISQHIGIFGCLTQRGSAKRWADFNAWCDPEAADRVVRAGIHTRIVALDVTRLMILHPDEVRAFAFSRDPLVKWLGEALRYYVTVHRNRDGLKGCHIHDALAIGELLCPGLMTFAAHGLRVDLDDGEHRGHTRVSLCRDPLHIAVDVDVALMRTLLDCVFGERWYAQQGAGENK